MVWIVDHPSPEKINQKETGIVLCLKKEGGRKVNGVALILKVLVFF
jgi:hypothetical protein